MPLAYRATASSIVLPSSTASSATSCNRAAGGASSRMATAAPAISPRLVVVARIHVSSKMSCGDSLSRAICAPAPMLSWAIASISSCRASRYCDSCVEGQGKAAGAGVGVVVAVGAGVALGRGVGDRAVRVGAGVAVGGMVGAGVGVATGVFVGAGLAVGSASQARATNMAIAITMAILKLPSLAAQGFKAQAR